jgi:Zn-dependent membrane protease YugP
MYPLVLQTVEEAFRRRVVPAAALAAHRAAHAIRAQLALEFVARVLGGFNLEGTLQSPDTVSHLK